MSTFKDDIDQMESIANAMSVLMQPIMDRLKRDGWMGEDGALTDKARAELEIINKERYGVV